MKRLLVMLVFVASSAHGEIYTWTDSRGADHYTNRTDDIPVRYRASAKALKYGTDTQTGDSSPQQNGLVQRVQPEGQPTVQRGGGGGAQLHAPSQPATDKREAVRQRKEVRRKGLMSSRERNVSKHGEQ